MTDYADVCVIGAGPSGAVNAERLREAGSNVTVLEQGGWPDYSRSREDQPDFELRQDLDWQWNLNVRRGSADYPVDDSESDVSALMRIGVGGSAVVYASQRMRNASSDFRVKTLDGIGDDWPMTYEDLGTERGSWGQRLYSLRIHEIAAPMSSRHGPRTEQIGVSRRVVPPHSWCVLFGQPLVRTAALRRRERESVLRGYGGGLLRPGLYGRCSRSLIPGVGASRDHSPLGANSSGTA